MFNWIISRTKLYKHTVRRIKIKNDVIGMQAQTIDKLTLRIVLTICNEQPRTKLTKSVYRSIQEMYDLPEMMHLPTPVCRLVGEPSWIIENIDAHNALALIDGGYVPPTMHLEGSHAT